MSQVMPNLWIGNISAANNKFLLIKNEIKSILSLGTEIGVPVFPTKFEYFVVGSQMTPNETIENLESCNILKHFLPCIKFI